MTEKVDDAFSPYRNVVADRLEGDLATVLASMGWPHKVNVPKPGGAIGIKNLPGEVDAIAVDIEGRVLWVIETKDPAQVFSAARIDNSIASFSDDNAYFAKLTKKVTVIAKQQRIVLKNLGVDSKMTFKVRGLIVTRVTVPAAYADPPVPFSTLFEVEDTLRLSQRRRR